jgi:hypothetical protein
MLWEVGLQKELTDQGVGGALHWGDREEGVSREEFGTSWGSALEEGFIHSDWVPHSAQNFFEVGGRRTFRVGVTHSKDLDSPEFKRREGRHSPKQQLLEPLAGASPKSAPTAK